MEIILQEDFPSLGYIGEKVAVKRGYARNFLIPKGIAVEFSSRNAKQFKHRLEVIERKKNRKKVEAMELAKTLEGLILEFKLAIGSQGKSFGSITVRDVESALESKNFKVDRKQIQLPEIIKTVGEHPVAIKLHSEVNAEITVRVLAANPPKAQEVKKQPKVEEDTEEMDFDDSEE